MVVVPAAEAVDVEGEAGGLGEALEAVGHHLAAEVADPLAREAELDDAEGPVRQVDDGAREGLVERRVRRPEPRKARRAPQRLREGVAERDAAVLGGVVVVDFCFLISSSADGVSHHLFKLRCAGSFVL